MDCSYYPVRVDIRLDKNDLMNIIWMKKLYSNLSLQRKAVEPAAWQPELWELRLPEGLLRDREQHGGRTQEEHGHPPHRREHRPYWQGLRDPSLPFPPWFFLFYFEIVVNRYDTYGLEDWSIINASFWNLRIAHRGHKDRNLWRNFNLAGVGNAFRL